MCQLPCASVVIIILSSNAGRTRVMAISLHTDEVASPTLGLVFCPALDGGCFAGLCPEKVSKVGEGLRAEGS